MSNNEFHFLVELFFPFLKKNVTYMFSSNGRQRVNKFHNFRINKFNISFVYTRSLHEHHENNQTFHPQNWRYILYNKKKNIEMC